MRALWLPNVGIVLKFQSVVDGIVVERIAEERMETDWTEENGKWFAEVNGRKLKQAPMGHGHWAGFIDDELRVEGGGLESNRKRLLAARSAPTA